MSKINMLFAIVAAFLSCAHVSAQETTQPGAARGGGEADGAGAVLDVRQALLHADTGIVTDQVITVAGQDFYQYFLNAWRDKEGSDRYTLAVRERPSARWGSEIWIEYGHARVFSTHLPAARAAIRPIGERAAEVAFQAVLQADAQRQLGHDPDVGPDEI